MSSAIRNPLLKSARNPSRSTAAPTLPIRQLITHKPTKGIDTSHATHQPFGSQADQLSMSHMARNRTTTTPTPVVDQCVPEPPNSLPVMDVDSATCTLNSFSPTVGPNTDTIMRTLVNYQVRADVAKAQPAAKPVKKRK